jgi:hypothetical protein
MIKRHLRDDSAVGSSVVVTDPVVTLPEGIAGVDFDPNPELENKRIKRMKSRMVTRVTPKAMIFSPLTQNRPSLSTPILDQHLGSIGQLHQAPILASPAVRGSLPTVTSTTSSYSVSTFHPISNNDDFYFTMGLSSASVFTALVFTWMVYYVCIKRRRQS